MMEKSQENLNKAIELLKEMSWYLDSINAQHDFDGLNNHNKRITKFLKSIE